MILRTSIVVVIFYFYNAFIFCIQKTNSPPFTPISTSSFCGVHHHSFLFKLHCHQEPYACLLTRRRPQVKKTQLACYIFLKCDSHACFGSYTAYSLYSSGLSLCSEGTNRPQGTLISSFCLNLLACHYNLSDSSVFFLPKPFTTIFFSSNGFISSGGFLSSVT